MIHCVRQNREIEAALEATGPAGARVAAACLKNLICNRKQQVNELLQELTFKN